MSELIYTKVNEVFRNIDGHYYKCVEGIGCRNCAFRGTGSCGQYVCAEATRPDRVPVKFVAVSDEPIEPKKEKEMEKDTATEEPSRHIELGVVKVEGDNVTFKIIEQTHKRKEKSFVSRSTAIFSQPLVIFSKPPMRLNLGLRIFRNG